MSLGSELRKPLTTAGKVYAAVVVVCVIGGSSLVQLFPDGWIARRVNSGELEPFVVAVVVLAAIVEFCLRILGVKLQREPPVEAGAPNVQTVSQGVPENSSRWRGGRKLAAAAGLLIGAALLASYLFGTGRMEMIKRGSLSEIPFRIQPVKEFYEKNGRMPATLEEAGVARSVEKKVADPETGESHQYRIVFALSGEIVTARIEGLFEGGPFTWVWRLKRGPPVEWDCKGGTLEDKYRPTACEKGR